MNATTNITITNVHPRGFGFGVVTETGDQIFIPSHAFGGVYELSAGDNTDAVLVPNPRKNDVGEVPTPWLAAKLHNKAQPNPNAQPDPVAASIDEQAFVALQSVAYASNNDMAEMLRADSKTVGNAMQRLFNAGRISRADVHHRVGQQRPSFLLWAISSNDFVEGEE